MVHFFKKKGKIIVFLNFVLIVHVHEPPHFATIGKNGPPLFITAQLAILVSRLNLEVWMVSFFFKYEWSETSLNILVSIF